MKNLVSKIAVRIWSIIVRNTRNTRIYPLLYNSYWHFLLYGINNTKKNEDLFFTARPNTGAGIGHQMANWIAGYWFAKQFNLKFAHIPFSNQKWEDFLGFGSNEIIVEDLLKKEYKKVLLPLFDENNEIEVNRIKSIIVSYFGKKVIFVTEQDQFYGDQFGVIDDIKKKFYNADARKTDNLVYDKNNFNIAIHVRRGDISVDQNNKNLNLLMRWQDNDYFINVLRQVIEKLKSKKRIAIYLFSQGKIKDFEEFSEFQNLTYCLDMNPQDSFLHMVYADILITSKSSFSYKPALLNNGIKICPQKFWHGYPLSSKWIIADENGSFELKFITNE